LDSNYRLIQSVWKHDTIAIFKDDIKTIYNNDRVEKTITKSSNIINNKSTEEIQIDVSKTFDKNGNPTILYRYINEDEKEITDVIYKYYKYY
jgi:hypothetical protein